MLFMKFKQLILFCFIFGFIFFEFGCASRASIKEYNKSEWIYLGSGAELEQFLIENKISYEVNPLGGISIERSTYKKVNDQIRTGVLLCFAIPFDIVTFPFQLIGLNHWSSQQGNASEQELNLGNSVGALLQAGFSHW